MTGVFRHAFFLLTLLCLAHAAGTTLPSLTASSICPSRTVNYITHGLPQQCLASSRAPGHNSTVPQEPNGTATLSTAQPSGNDTNASSSAHGLSSSNTKSEETEITAPVGESISTTSLSNPVTPSSLPLSAYAIDDDGTEADSALGNGKFLSFEDWKKQNLLKAGQSEHLGNERSSEQHEPRKRPANINNALDSIGDDVEIDLNFAGFVPAGPDLASPKQSSWGGQEGEPVRGEADELPAAPESRGKDAGTTSKERFNYASFDCAANVLKTNKEAKSASAVLGENKDSYMLNECSANNKFLILELCNDVKIDTIVLANFEFFSSTFRTVRVSASDKYPVKADKWKLLGEFEARSSREVQPFLVENPVIWTRFVRIEFLTHYGSEFYCPLSLVRVHGTTMLEEYKHDRDSGQGEDDEDDLEGSEKLEEQEILVPEAIADILVEEERLAATRVDGDIEMATQLSQNATQKIVSELESVNSGVGPQCDEPDSYHCTHGATGGIRALLLYPSLPGTTTNRNTSKADFSSCELKDKKNKEGEQLFVADQTSMSDRRAYNSNSASNEPQSSQAAAIEPDSKMVNAGTETLSKSSNLSSTKPSSGSSTATNGTSSEKPKVSASSTNPAPAAPTMQESFFKSVQKRLQVLETSSSLSLQYIEEQSRALRDAFTKVEQRQLAKTGTFLDYLNSTVLNELRDFRQQYDQLWQSTVIELDMQREQFQAETVAINTRLGVLADEVIFQKRMAILQMVLILVCLGLILFSRGPMHNYLELPIVQNMLARSPSSRWMHIPGLETPSQSPAISRPSSSHQMKPDRGILKGHARNLSENSIETTTSAVDNYSPMTPTSYDELSDGERRDEVAPVDDPVFDPATIERPSTSPPVLPSGEGPMTPESLPALGDHTDSIESRLLDPSSPETPGRQIPRVYVEDATPQSKHLKWQLPDS